MPLSLRDVQLCTLTMTLETNIKQQLLQTCYQSIHCRVKSNIHQLNMTFTTKYVMQGHLYMSYLGVEYTLVYDEPNCHHIEL